MEGISGILLTGGKSRRMGTDKASLPFGAGTLLTVQLEKFRALGITDVRISGYGDGMIPDDVPGCGPLGGLAACLKRIRGGCALVLSIDVPLVPEAVLRGLIEAHTGGVTLLRHGERSEPLIAVYDAALGETADRLLCAGKRAVWSLLDEAGCRILDTDADERCFLNCNTPEDYQKALQTRL